MKSILKLKPYNIVSNIHYEVKKREIIAEQELIQQKRLFRMSMKGSNKSAAEIEVLWNETLKKLEEG